MKFGVMVEIAINGQAVYFQEVLPPFGFGEDFSDAEPPATRRAVATQWMICAEGTQTSSSESTPAESTESECPPDLFDGREKHDVINALLIAPDAARRRRAAGKQGDAGQGRAPRRGGAHSVGRGGISDSA